MGYVQSAGPRWSQYQRTIDFSFASLPDYRAKPVGIGPVAMDRYVDSDFPVASFLRYYHIHIPSGYAGVGGWHSKAINSSKTPNASPTYFRLVVPLGFVGILSGLCTYAVLAESLGVFDKLRRVGKLPLSSRIVPPVGSILVGFGIAALSFWLLGSLEKSAEPNRNVFTNTWEYR